MKCVLFICLLSLSTCFTSPVQDTNTINTTLQVVADHAAPAADNKTTEKAVENTTQITDPTKDKKETSPTPPAGNTPEETPKAPEENAKNPTQDVPKDNKTVPITVAPNNAGENTTSTEKASPTTTVSTTPTTVPPANDKTSSTSTTTPKPEIVKTTPAAEKDDKLLKARAFDGPSFIGGIILTLGLLAIGFMGFKYYKNQTERNYHTL